MKSVKRWSTQHASSLEKVYSHFEQAMVTIYRLCRHPDNRFVNRCVFVVEKAIKTFLFDSKMCGDCLLSSTGMTCPMNCPKKMRNGPCGGVRQNGNCELEPDMPCVWLDAFVASLQIEQGVRILKIQEPVDHRLQNTSSWLYQIRRIVRGE